MQTSNKYIPSEAQKGKYHYVYLLISLVEEKYYVGARTCTCAVDEDAYMGSSKVMTAVDKENCDKLILAEFNTREEAIAYEIELHAKFDVSANPLFWNAVKQTSTGFDTTGRAMSDEEKAMRSAIQKVRFANGHHATGTKLTEEHKKKISKGLLGREHTDETKARIQKAHRARAIKHHKFEPWYYEVGGVRTEVYDKTIREFAEELGVNFDVVKDRFKNKFAGKELTRGVLKGYTFGRIKDDR